MSIIDSISDAWGTDYESILIAWMNADAEQGRSCGIIGFFCWEENDA